MSRCKRKSYDDTISSKINSEGSASKNTKSMVCSKTLSNAVTLLQHSLKLDGQSLNDLIDHEVLKNANNIDHIGIFYYNQYYDEVFHHDIELKEYAADSNYDLKVKSLDYDIEPNVLCESILYSNREPFVEPSLIIVDADGRELSVGTITFRSMRLVDKNHPERNYFGLFNIRNNSRFDIIAVHLYLLKFPSNWMKLVCDDPYFKEQLKNLGYNPYTLTCYDYHSYVRAKRHYRYTYLVGDFSDTKEYDDDEFSI